MQRRLHNIIIEEKGESLTYVPPNGGGGEPNYPPRSSRWNHAAYIKKQLDTAWEEAVNESKAVAATTVRDGVYLQMEGKEGYDLLTKSLEDTRQHVRLLNVNNADGVIKATVYVPNKKKDFFLKKLINMQRLIKDLML